MNKEQVDKWLKEEYGMTFEELEELHDFQCDRVIEKAKEIERLKDIIKEVREYIEQYGNLYCLKHTQFKNYHQYKVILEILDKVGEK